MASERSSRKFATLVQKTRLTRRRLTHICASSKRTRPHYEVSRSFRAFSSRHNRCPERIEPGEEARRLFDIVGLDEGTCGRRPGHR
jgi:hypothetical protein